MYPACACVTRSTSAREMVGSSAMRWGRDVVRATWDTIFSWPAQFLCPLHALGDQGTVLHQARRQKVCRITADACTVGVTARSQPSNCGRGQSSPARLPLLQSHISLCSMIVPLLSAASNRSCKLSRCFAVSCSCCSRACRRAAATTKLSRSCTAYVVRGVVAGEVGARVAASSNPPPPPTLPWPSLGGGLSA